MDPQGRVFTNEPCFLEWRTIANGYDHQTVLPLWTRFFSTKIDASKRKVWHLGHPGSYATYHFIMESTVSALRHNIGPNDLVLLESTPSSFQIEWLELVGIPPSNVVGGSLYHVQGPLRVPKLSPCGKCDPEGLEKLRRVVVDYVSSTTDENEKVIVVVRRSPGTNPRRSLLNHDEMFDTLVDIVKPMGYTIVEHDDRRLGSVVQQLEKFVRADVVVGPHGAGMTNALVSKRHACMLEFQDVRKPNRAFIEMTQTLGMSHEDIDIVDRRIDMDDFVRALLRCVERVDDALDEVKM